MTCLARLIDTVIGIGLDVGTSGVRGVALNQAGESLAVAALPLPEPQRQGAQVAQEPALWRDALFRLIPALLSQIDRRHVAALCLDATSGTVLLADEEGKPLGPALMYNDGRATAEARRIGGLAPRECAAHGVSSSLAKALWLLSQSPRIPPPKVLHQGDWLIGELTGEYQQSDENTCLKLGYDPVRRCWPPWLTHLGIQPAQLPRVHRPGAAIAPLRAELAAAWGLSPNVAVLAGTTDSTAGFLATGADSVGDAVTSLGSTLVLKVLAKQPVFAPENGVYSQPLADLWLVGGGSNTGGTVLRQLFSPAQISALTARLDPDHATGLDYYPLPGVGERFPDADPTMLPRLTPRPSDDAVFFQGILEAMAQIELRGYQRLAELGAPYPRRVMSIGGGAANLAWTRIRGQRLGVPMVAPEHQDAAYGAARLTLPYLQALASDDLH